MNDFILIDDDAIINLIHTKMITNLTTDFKVISFQDPEEGMNFFNSFMPEADRMYYVFIDLNMPGKNGWSILEELSETSFIDQLNIYILSSSTNKADKERADQHPHVKEYLEKPMLEHLLKEKINVAS